MPGGPGAPPDFRFSHPASRSRNRDLPGLRILRHREDRHGREPAAAIAMRGRKTLLIDLARQANGSISFPDHGAIDRSMFDGIADPACELAQIIPAGPDASEPVRRTREGSASPNSNRDRGELDAHFRLRTRLSSREVTTLAGHRLSAGFRAADGQCPGGRGAPDFRFSRPCFALEGLGILRRGGRPTTAANLAAGARREGTQGTPRRSRPISQQQHLVPGPRHERSPHVRRDRRSGERARSIIQPAATLQNRFVRTRG